MTELVGSGPATCLLLQLTAVRDHPCPGSVPQPASPSSSSADDHCVPAFCRPPGPSASGVPVSLGAGRTLSSKAVSVKSEAALSGSPAVTCAGGIYLTARPPAGHPEKLSGRLWALCSEVCNRWEAGKIPRRTGDFRSLGRGGRWRGPREIPGRLDGPGGDPGRGSRRKDQARPAPIRTQSLQEARCARPMTQAAEGLSRFGRAHAARATEDLQKDQPRSTVIPATVRLPRRSTRKRPCSRSAWPGRASGSATLRLFR